VVSSEAQALEDLRIGILGASSVAEYAVIEPSTRRTGITVVGLGSRDPAAAADYARRLSIARVTSYDELIADPHVEAVYVGLPNALHAEWTIRALEAGKSVLCEKPLASNAAEARAMFAAAASQRLLLMEALHWRWHPLARMVAETVGAGRLGTIREASARFLIPGRGEPWAQGFRSKYALGGGAAMDAGAYCLDFLRYVLGEPLGVRWARAVEAARQVDEEMEAELAFAGGAVGRLHVSHVHDGPYVIDAEIRGEKGAMRIQNPFLPHWGHRVELKIEGVAQAVECDLTPTYDFQARGFAAAARGEGDNLSPPANSLANMRAMDALYEAAGLRIRGLKGSG